MHEQRTQGWFNERAGILTASRMHRVFAGKPRGWRTLMRELAAEQAKKDLDIEHGGGPDSFAMARGREREPQALAQYHLKTGREPRTVGFQVHPVYSFIGASSDFIAGDRNGEIKCPTNPSVHAAHIMGSIAPAYLTQMQTQMACHDLGGTDFVSFCPEWPDPEGRLITVEVSRDQAYIDRIVRNAIIFWEQYQAGQSE